MKNYEFTIKGRLAAEDLEEANALLNEVIIAAESPSIAAEGQTFGDVAEIPRSAGGNVQPLAPPEVTSNYDRSADEALEGEVVDEQLEPTHED